ncbi:MAG: hypothetical protein JWR24_502 [Actinoallomurus sp.]|nr:hypothetical protein [Actinoallomurus sp.]
MYRESNRQRAGRQAARPLKGSERTWQQLAAAEGVSAAAACGWIPGGDVPGDRVDAGAGVPFQGADGGVAERTSNIGVLPASTSAEHREYRPAL